MTRRDWDHVEDTPECYDRWHDAGGDRGPDCPRCGVEDEQTETDWGDAIDRAMEREGLRRDHETSMDEGATS
jgi:hypothetical protein